MEYKDVPNAFEWGKCEGYKKRPCGHCTYFRVDMRGGLKELDVSVEDTIAGLTAGFKLMRELYLKPCETCLDELPKDIKSLIN